MLYPFLSLKPSFVSQHHSRPKPESGSEPQTVINSVSTADIQWENGLPISTRFNDVYFSRSSGIDETRHVFLKHNHLPERFAAMHSGETLTIGETGFGTGLNFLCAWQLFLDTAPQHTTLHFLSTEKYPLQPDDLKKALVEFTKLSDLSDKLIRAYRVSSERIELTFANEPNQKRVILQVLIGDVLTTLPSANTTVDAWFLDGFAPAKNPQMWQPALFNAMKDKSHPSTTYATFTAARIVRDGLEQAGFTVTKQPGFGRKRDMLAGHLLSDHERLQPSKPWFSLPNHINREKTSIVVGGGLAGCCVARSLAERGWQVTILEQHNGLAHEASGNPQGIIYAKLSADNTPLSQFILQGYHFTLNLLKRLNLQDWQQCGVAQLATDAKTHRRYQSLDALHPNTLLQYLDERQLSDIAGLTIDYPGLYFPEAGWVHPPALCKALADHPNITVISNVSVESLDQDKEAWLVTATDKQFRSKTVVIAQGTASGNLSQLDYLPLKSIRGQITRVKTTGDSERLKTCVCAEGYVAPAVQGEHTLGATFHFKDTSRTVREQDHQENLTTLKAGFPAFYEALGAGSTTVTGGRTGFRCTTPDYLPMVGPIVDTDDFLKTYAPLRKNSKLPMTDTPRYLDGLYVTTGHGSRGIISCPIAGEALAEMITGNNTTKSLPMKLLEALHPSRFLVRDLIRNKV